MLLSLAPQLLATSAGSLISLKPTAGTSAWSPPDGRRFIDVDALAAKTGHTVRSAYKDPDASDVLPPADAMIVAPITCNSLAKWAAGISDTLPLGLLVEAVGKRQPVVAVPFSNRAQLSFPAVQDAIRKLAGWGVTCWSATRSTSSTNREPARTSSICSRGTVPGRHSSTIHNGTGRRSRDVPRPGSP